MPARFDVLMRFLVVCVDRVTFGITQYLGVHRDALQHWVKYLREVRNLMIGCGRWQRVVQVSETSYTMYRVTSSRPTPGEFLVRVPRIRCNQRLTVCGPYPFTPSTL